MSIEIRPVEPEELAAFLRVDSIAFGREPAEEDVAAVRAILDCEHTLAVVEAGSIVASAAWVPFQLTLPGNTSIVSPGITFVAVLPTHRRRGYLRALMQRQLQDLSAAGATLSILYASESGIYGRFGYGPASQVLHLEIEQHDAAFRPDAEHSGTLHLLDRDASLRVFPDLHERVCRARPGAVSRGRLEWEFFALPAGGEHFRETFQVLYKNAEDDPEGYARYRLEPKWGSYGPESILTVNELIACTPEAHSALWRYCLSVDLVRTIRARNCPVDEPLRWLLQSPHRLRVAALSDGLWVRLLDIAAALTARRYASDGQLTLEIRDAYMPQNSGRFALEIKDGFANCARTTAMPDLVIAVDDLAAVYLGGVSFNTLAWTGRLGEQTPGAVARAGSLFAVQTAPWCPTHF